MFFHQKELQGVYEGMRSSSSGAASTAPRIGLPASPDRKSPSNCCCYNPGSPTLALRLEHEHEDSGADGCSFANMTISILQLCVCDCIHFHKMVHSPGDIITVSDLCWTYGCHQYLVTTATKLSFSLLLERLGGP